MKYENGSTVRIRRLKDLYCEYQVDFGDRDLGDYVRVGGAGVLCKAMEGCCGSVMTIKRPRDTNYYFTFEFPSYGFNSYLFETQSPPVDF